MTVSLPYRILFLGAGFSAPAGIPLGSSLFPLIRARIFELFGGSNKFERDLGIFLEFQRRCYGRVIEPMAVDCEEFLGFLDTEHYLGLRGKDTWSEDGNESQLLIRMAIGQIICERLPANHSQLPNVYRAFAQRLRPHDVVFTFNYDTLLEMALDAEGVKYRLFPNRYKAVHATYSEVDSSDEEVILIKLHGSIDWFSRTSFDTLEKELARVDAMLSPPASTNRPSHPIFGYDAVVTHQPLVDGLRRADDPLRNIFRVIEPPKVLRSLYFKCSPFILAPSSTKIFYARPILEFWRGLQSTGSLNLGMGIVGYSLPKYDDHALQVLYNVCLNYLETEVGAEFHGRKKTPLRIVDFRKQDDDIAAFQQRYRFLNGLPTEADFSGFDERTAAWVLQ